MSEDRKAISLNLVRRLVSPKIIEGSRGSDFGILP
jgi:hypothetical protein